MDKIYSLR